VWGSVTMVQEKCKRTRGGPREKIKHTRGATLENNSQKIRIRAGTNIPVTQKDDKRTKGLEKAWVRSPKQ